MKPGKPLPRNTPLKARKQMKPQSDKRKRAATPLRKAAEGQTCTLRLDGCAGGTETTVLAHLRHFGWAGAGQKPPDYLAVFACWRCHDAIDGRSDHAQWGYDDLLRGLGETLNRQFAAGKIVEVA